MKVEIWSDVVCPWCHIGKRNFEAALAAFEHRDDVEVEWKAFELDPSSPVERQGAYAENLAKKYGLSIPDAQAMLDQMTARAASVGLDFRFDVARPGNTFDAHRLIHLAGERGVQDGVKERFLTATFAEGEPIGDHETLTRLAVQAGLDETEVRTVLGTDAYADAVRTDEREAAEIGVRGVPFFVFDRTFAVSGAQPPEALLDVLAEAWARANPKTLVVTGGSGAPGCDGDTCAM